jgi:hypothetical protein
MDIVFMIYLLVPIWQWIIVIAKLFIRKPSCGYYIGSGLPMLSNDTTTDFHSTTVVAFAAIFSTENRR